MDDHLSKGLRQRLGELSTIEGSFTLEYAAKVMGISQEKAREVIRVLTEFSLVQYVNSVALVVRRPVPNWAQ